MFDSLTLIVLIGASVTAIAAFMRFPLMIELGVDLDRAGEDGLLTERRLRSFRSMHRTCTGGLLFVLAFQVVLVLVALTGSAGAGRDLALVAIASVMLAAASVIIGSLYVKAESAFDDETGPLPWRCRESVEAR